VRLLGRAIVRIVTEPGRNHKSEEFQIREPPGACLNPRTRPGEISALQFFRQADIGFEHT